MPQPSFKTSLAVALHVIYNIMFPKDEQPWEQRLTSQRLSSSQVVHPLRHHSVVLDT
jgi:hypothetical protein